MRSVELFTFPSSEFFASRHNQDAVFSPAFRVFNVLALGVDLFVVICDERLDVWIDGAVRRILRDIWVVVFV